MIIQSDANQHNGATDNPFQDYLKVCVKTLDGMIIGSSTPDFNYMEQDAFIVKGQYKVKHGVIRMGIRFGARQKAERYVIGKLDLDGYEFHGTRKVGKTTSSVRMSFQGEQAYYDNLCDESLGR